MCGSLVFVWRHYPDFMWNVLSDVGRYVVVVVVCCDCRCWGDEK